MRQRYVLFALTLACLALAAPAQELIRNPRFDTDLSGWARSFPVFRDWDQPSWTAADDADGNPRSGSARTDWFCTLNPACFDSTIRQCVPVRPGGTYLLSLAERGSSAGLVAASWFSSADCAAGNPGVAVEAELTANDWQSWRSSLSAPEDARAVQLTLKPRMTSRMGAFGHVGWDDVSLQVLTEPPAATRTQLIPTAANAPGLFDAHFKTRVTLLSLGSSRQSSVRLEVLPSALGRGPVGVITLAPAAVVTFEDFLGALGYEGGAAIVVSHAEDQPLHVTAEVYAESPSGRYTTVVPVITDPASDRRRVTSGVTNSGLSRANLGCASLSDRDELARAEVHGPDGSELGTLLLTVPRRGWVQRAIPFSVSDGYVIWGTFANLAGPPEGVSCFAVVVDNASNDGSLLR